jgi:hypothetical protein
MAVSAKAEALKTTRMSDFMHSSHRAIVSFCQSIGQILAAQMRVVKADSLLQCSETASDSR